jgi:hypothetical protein
VKFDLLQAKGPIQFLLLGLDKFRQLFYYTQVEKFYCGGGGKLADELVEKE